MTRAGIWRSALCVALVLSAVSCDAQRDPVGVGDLSAKVQPMCQLPCGAGEDPYPSSPGLYLNGLSRDDCDGGTDLDQDGLSDACEGWLAEAFAPEMRFTMSGFENVGREPRFVAQWWDDDPTHVNIMYLMSYYHDLGSPSPYCPEHFSLWFCEPHYGDSEWVLLSVYYNASTEHWVLSNAWYSQHGSDASFSPGPRGYPANLEYPSKRGGYPRVYVAWYKHANYESEYACNNGAFLNSEVCASNLSERLAIGGALNIGSRAHPFADQVYSTNPLYSGNGPEYFWTEHWFCGWQGAPPCDGSSGSYSQHLAAMGF